MYLDYGLHVNLEDRPNYYCGVLNLFKLAHMPRPKLTNRKELDQAQDRFQLARQQLLAEGGGIVSVIYHPCEFVQSEFWDGVNFRNGANPPRDQWKLPRTRTAEETQIAYGIFEDYVRFMKRFAEVRFITASEAAELYADRARSRKFTVSEIKQIAAANMRIICRCTAWNASWAGTASTWPAQPCAAGWPTSRRCCGRWSSGWPRKCGVR